MKPVPGLEIEDQPEPVVFAMCLLGEARGSGYDGMAAVANSIVNRLSHAPRYGRTIKEIVLRPWQYSCFLPSDPNRAKMLDFWFTDPLTWAKAEDIVSKASAGALEDKVGPATHYLVEKLWGYDDSEHIAAGHSPRWYSSQAIAAGITHETARIGGHVFATTA